MTRYIESTISKKMKSSGVILVEGPKFCGKTTTSAPHIDDRMGYMLCL